MKQDINFNDFCNSFSDSYKNNFSYEGKKALYNYLIQYEEDTGEELELAIDGVCEFKVWGERNEEGTMIILVKELKIEG